MQYLFAYYISEVIAKPLLPMIVPVTHSQLPQHSRAHFMASPPPKYTTAQQEEGWKAVEQQFDNLADILDKNPDANGDWFTMGHEVSYADFALCAVLIWIRTVVPQEAWSRVRQWNGGRWVKFYDYFHCYMDVC